MLDIDKYRSVTWQMGGRAFPVLDCYGIVHEVRKDLGLPEWPAFEGIIKEGDEMDKAAKNFSRNVKACMPGPGVVAACYKAGMITHVAVIVDIDGQLHAIESNPKTNVTILPLRRFERKFVKVEYYQ
jgi:hypothetical protein